MTDAHRVSGSDRRGLLLVVAGCLTAAAVLLLASGQAWLRVSLPARAPFPGVTQALTGQEVVDVLVPVGILVGAAGLALIAARRVGRLVVASVVVVASVLVLAAVGWFLYDDGFSVALSWAQARTSTVGVSAIPDHDVSVAPGVLALLGAGLSLAVGLLTILRSGRWPTMGARYERRTGSASGGTERLVPAAGAASADGSGTANDNITSEAVMWAAMERGEDPTAGRSVLGADDDP